MAQLGRLHDVLHRPTGVPAAGATVEVRRQGATVTANQSGTSPFVVTVADPGAIRVADTVAVNLGGTTYDVDAIGITTVTISGFAGTLALNAGDRLTPVNNLPTLYADARQVNTLAGGNPMETDQNGEFAAWVDVSPFDLKVTGGGYASRLFQDVWPAGVVTVRVNASPDPAGEGYVFDVRGMPASGKIIRFQLDGTDVFFINADGTISGTVAVSVPDPLTLVNGLTVGGLATFNNGAGVVGGLTVDNFTGTGTFTVAAGAIASAALAANAATASLVTVRGGSADVSLLTTEVVRVTTGYTPVGTPSKLRIVYNAEYTQNADDSNLKDAEVRLYIDGVLAYKTVIGLFDIGAGGPTMILHCPAHFVWEVSGLTAAAHTIEVRDIAIQRQGAGGVMTYNGATVAAALFISEAKK